MKTIKIVGVFFFTHLQNMVTNMQLKATTSLTPRIENYGNLSSSIK